MADFSDEDDYRHTPKKQRDWRESWYFNWVDLKTQVSGFSTIGVLPHQQKREFIFALFTEGIPEFYFTEPKGPIPEDFHQVLNDKNLVFELVKPFVDWRIHYKSPRLKAEIHWQSRFPACDFGGGSGTSWGHHFEQSGIITGYVEYPNQRVHHIHGYGQRDKSWGIRNWHIDEWYALHAQFDDLMIGLRYDKVKGKEHLSGCISSENGNIPLTQIQINTQFEEGTIRKPIKTETHLRDKTGRTFTLHSELIHPMSFARYSRQFEDGETELFEEMVVHKCEELETKGTGLVEWLFTHHRKR
jgi:hypothetical protein